MANQEVRTNTIREISFYGESKADAIEGGAAFVTLRNPNPNYDFNRGEIILAHCVDDKRKIYTVSLGIETKPLGEYSLPFLALDGFLSHQAAVSGMRLYPKYENTSLTSPMQGVLLLYKPSFDELSSHEQALATTTPLQKLPYEPSLRYLFLPTMCFWFADQGRTTAEWVDFLETNKLLSAKEIEVVRSLNPDGKALVEIFDNPHDPLAAALVFGQFSL